jgi:hypothetical protein
MAEQEEIDGLAAEYALGSLDPTERRYVDLRKRTDSSLSAAIDVWEQRLVPLNERGVGIEPPAHLLDEILSRVLRQAPRQPEVAEVEVLSRASGRRWALVAGASALAASLVLVIVWSVPHLPLPQEHSRLDCGKLYKNFWQTRDAESYARISSEQLAGISRMALRAYDACLAGDEQDAKGLLARLLGRSGDNSPPSGQHRAAAET